MILLNTLALEHTLTKQIKYDFVEHASLRTYSHQTNKI